VVKGGLSPHTLEAKPEIVAFVRELLQRQTDEGYAACCAAMAEAVAADPKAIAAPVLVIQGADDAVSPPATGEGLVKELPRGELRVLPQCGHWLPIEQPHAVNEALQRFL
jgi:3-oxoadipate enol-lactonase